MAPRFRLKRSVLSAAVLGTMAAYAQAETPATGEPATPPANTQPPAGTPAPVALGEKPVTVLPAVNIEGQPLSKQKSETRSGTRTETPLRDIPQFINTVPETVLKQQGATTLADALKNVPGISYAAPEGGTQANTLYYLRGFPAGGDLFVDGLRDVGEYTRDIFNVETVEVLKGPSALTFGRGSTGGVINEVTKLPSLFGRSEVSATLGTFETKRATADINVKTGATAAVRLVAMGEDSGSYRYPQGNERLGFAPSIRLGIGTDTELSVAHMYLKTEDVTDYGQPTIFANGVFYGFAPVSAEKYYGFADHDFAHHTTNMTTATLDHRFGTLVSLRNALRWATYERRMEATIPSLRATDINGAPVTGSTPPELLVVTRNHDTNRSRDNDDDALVNQTELTWRFSTAGLNHTLLTGLELGRERLNRHNNQLDADPLTPFAQTPTATTSLLDPDPFTQLSYSKQVNQKARAIGETAALYLQDQFELARTLKALLGLRFERYNASADTFQVNATATVPAGTTTRFERADNMLSGRAGLIWQPTDQQSYYVSFGNSYNPSGELGVYGGTATNLSTQTEDLDPEKNRNYEAGGQWDFTGGLRLRAAVFRNEKTNARMPDPTTAGVTILAGKRRVDGVELELSGSITPAWEVYSGVAYMDGEIVTGTANVQGKRPLGVAALSGSVWTTFRIGGGFEIGGGVRATTGAYLNDANLAKVPSYRVLDLTAAYVQTNYEIRVNAMNVTDEVYYYGGYQNSPNRVLPGQPRTYTATVRYLFN